MNNHADQLLLEAILRADNTTRPHLICAYWADSARADRTPKRVCYQHLALLAGMLQNAEDRAHKAEARLATS